MAVSADNQILIDILKYKETFDYPVFVETGTSNGQSTTIFSKHFEKTYTCENMKEGEEERIEILNHFGNNVTYMLGDSKDCLPIFFNEIGHDKFFLFLDAHGTSWPIMDELQIVADFGYKPFIFIHDFDCKHEGWRFDQWGKGFETINLDYKYVKPMMDLIYGEGNYGHEVSQTSQNPLDGEGIENFRGCGFFFPKI
jgi:hypothetical protein